MKQTNFKSITPVPNVQEVSFAFFLSSFSIAVSHSSFWQFLDIVLSRTQRKTPTEVHKVRFPPFCDCYRSRGWTSPGGASVGEQPEQRPGSR